MHLARTLAHLSSYAPYLVSRPVAPRYAELVRRARPRTVGAARAAGMDLRPAAATTPIHSLAEARSRRPGGGGGGTTHGGLAG